jgi:hypothetical protein
MKQDLLMGSDRSFNDINQALKQEVAKALARTH